MTEQSSSAATPDAGQCSESLTPLVLNIAVITLHAYMPALLPSLLPPDIDHGRRP